MYLCSLISDGYEIVHALSLPCTSLIHRSQILVHDVSNNRAMNIQSDKLIEMKREISTRHWITPGSKQCLSSQRVRFSISTPNEKFTCRAEESVNCTVCVISIVSSDRILIAGRGEWDLRGTLGRILGGEVQLGETRRHLCLKTCFSKVKKAQKLCQATNN